MSTSFQSDYIMNSQELYTPEVTIISSPGEVDQFAVDLVIKQIKNKPDSVLTLPTGSTPIGMYRLLIDAYHHGLDFSQIKTFNLDEYIGLRTDHPESYINFMRRNLFDHINILTENIFIPNGLAADLNQETVRYDKLLTQSGPSDLVILGIGPGGHIAFNLPGTSQDSRTHIVNLDQQTIQANSRFFSSLDQVPRKAITQGIANILEGRRIILIAKGQTKANDIYLSLKADISPNIPASFLRLHPRVTFLLDNEAASRL
jgi:glucosamine-6-phosphate deaminase